MTLIRRVTFDLTGLPPTPAAVAAVLEDRRPDAYERYVDQLLASPHFGERMAVYWLDLVRYADTVGYHGDQDHNISPYRDYVIDAFNANLPFDRFTREQLAGDLLPDPTVEQVVATGYNRMLQTSHEGGVQPREYLAIYAADRVRNLSSVWMAGTMGCAQCHDHKFDPYTARDFYSMEAFFADIDEAGHFTKGGNRLPTERPPEIDVLSPLDRRELADLEREVDRLQQPCDASKSPLQAAELEARLTDLNAQLEAVRQRARRTMITVSIPPREIRILPRGDWLDDSGEVVSPAVPQFLGQIATQGRPTRLDLANWLVDPAAGSGGLTARVVANRLWYLCFQSGIARILDDFGGQGEPPVHPELLDNLAIEFLRQRLGRQAHDADARDQPYLPPIVARDRAASRAGPLQPALCPTIAGAVTGRNGPRQQPGHQRVADTRTRRARHSTLSAGRLLPASQLPQADLQARS